MKKGQLKIFLLSGIIIAFFAILGYLRAVAPARFDNGQIQVPKIMVEPNTWDFGEVKYGQILEYTFKVKNLGEKDLEIKRVATSCACTSAKISQEKIGPDQETSLLVTYDTGAMGELHGRGKQERIIYLKSNDPGNPQVEVIIRAIIK